MIVMKFGGTSVGTAARCIRAAEIVEQRLAEKPVVVVSAHGGVTDILLNAARQAAQGKTAGLMQGFKDRHQTILEGLGLDPTLHDDEYNDLAKIIDGIALIRELTPRTYDYIAAFGERCSTRCLAALMHKRGHRNAEYRNSYDVGFLTDSNFLRAKPLPETYELIRKEVAKLSDKLLFVTGFLGKDADGNITTIGRSGTDYSASIFGAALGAKRIEIWKDVDGVMTADPSLIKEARNLPLLSFDEASELTYYGAQVLHPSTMVPAIQKNIPIHVLNVEKPNDSGTVIVADTGPTRETVTSITYKEDITLVTIISTRMLGAEGFLQSVFSIFGKHKVVVDMLATSEVSVSLTVDNDKNLPAAVEELTTIATVKVEKEHAIICVVGQGMKERVGIAATVFNAVAAAGVNLRMISQGASEINIAFVVRNDGIGAAVKALHDMFFGKHRNATTKRLAAASQHKPGAKLAGVGPVKARKK
ncbi:MAG TPA: aspartate kinase [Planctomycetota bacterium]|nr:aspartate kinase [Planctomycetota bacterium]